MEDSEYLKKRVAEYFYDRDYNFYHNTGKEVIRITRKEYKEKTGESDYIIEKLRNSNWPFQIKDYYFMRIEKKKVEYVPIDWAIYNLVIYFNKNGFPTYNILQQGKISKKSEDISSISFWIQNDELFLFLKREFGDLVMETHNYHDFRKDGYNTPNKWWDKSVHGNKIVFSRQHVIDRQGRKAREYIELVFENKLIYKMSDVLGIKYPDHSNAHTGKRLVGGSILDRALRLLKE